MKRLQILALTVMIGVVCIVPDRQLCGAQLLERDLLLATPVIDFAIDFVLPFNKSSFVS